MFVIKEDGNLVPLKATKFELEDHFQQLLEDHPELLDGELIDPDEPRRWLLVTREMGVPDEAYGSNSWSADHLFLDQDGIPTIVEVKRQTDTRLRREVVGQMLDYAAHGSAYWTLESIQSSFKATCEKKGKEPEQELREKLGQEIDDKKFWLQVKTNLEAQKIRLLFVSDVIPRELRRVVEFLNRQMNPVEVLALELRQYSGDNGLRTLAPTLFGQTEEARGIKSTQPGRKWDEETFFSELALRSSPEALHVAQQIYGWLRKNASRVLFGHGKIDGSIIGYFLVNELKLYPMTLSTQGKVVINFGDCRKPPFDDEMKRREWLSRINSIQGISFSDDVVSRYPSVPLSILAVQGRAEKLLSVMDWFVEELRDFQNLKLISPIDKPLS